VKSNPDVLAASGTGEGLPIKAFNGFLAKHFQDKNVKVPVQSMSVDYNFLSTMGINLIKGRDFSEAFGSDLLPFLKAEWKNAVTDRPFNYSMIEEHIRDIYSSERNLSTIVSIFALFALLIAAFGLFGLTLFVVRTRTKEIGIKKIFGSSERSIIYSFLQGNFVLVLSASLLSIPVTLYVMTKWLNNFSFKVHISCWVFAIPFAISTIVVLSTVFIDSYKASRINPVKALKYD
jgi:putative ABC transport system permease protein